MHNVSGKRSLAARKNARKTSWAANCLAAGSAGMPPFWPAHHPGIDASTGKS